MLTSSPGQTTITTESGIPSGLEVGYQIVKAATNLVVVARTAIGVVERPMGTGNYVITFVAPSEGDLYLLVIDWSDGVLSPETVKVLELQVSETAVAGSSGLGAMADYVRMHLGGETWNGLYQSSNFGPTDLRLALDTVKARVGVSVPTEAESTLHPLLLDYLGILGALQLIDAGRDYWGSQHIQIGSGDDGSESVTYANRAGLMEALRASLLTRVPAAQAAALPYVDAPTLRSVDEGPQIDEDDDCRVTEDPRAFPQLANYPGGPVYSDATGYPTRVPERFSGVRL